MKKHPYILAIAGFDPSGGAGLMADIKTIEAIKGYGLGVCTANTIQNDISFQSCNWVDFDSIKQQIEVLFNRFEIDAVKIGIIENWSVLNQVVDLVIEKNRDIKIIVDPILSSSTNYDFQDREQSEQELDHILDKIHLLIPNYEEIQRLYKGKSIAEAIKYISAKTNLYLKGGHNSTAIGKDELFTKGQKDYVLNPKGSNISEKHGSGCVLSSAITAYLGLGFPLLKACYRGKRYVEKVLSSNESLLGYHRI